MPWSRPKRTLAALAATTLATAGFLIATASPATAANAGPGFPAHYAAPYAEMWLPATTMVSAMNATGNKYYTLAFVISNGSCTPLLNGDIAITDSGWNSAINSVRAAGGDVIASFGGASGEELGQACTSVSSLQAAYKSVIDQLNLTRVDFDIEGGPLDDTAANDRRNQALANLQAAYAASGKTLTVDYTLPVLPTGLLSDSLSLLNNAKSHNVNVNLVNIMTMDYGYSTDMGAAATQAATALHGQLGSIWTTKTSAQLWAMEGNTPMIGVNDTTSEIFTTGNASTLESFAASNGIQELSYWSLGRDNQSSSGTSQSTYQFLNTFKAITGGSTGGGGGGGGGGTTGSAITGYGGKCVDVRSASSADGTPVQIYTCNGTTAQQWTHSGTTFQALGKCLDVAAAGTANGTHVQLYTCNGTGAQQWTSGANNSLVNTNSGKCLDDTGWSTTDGTQLQIWSCTGAANQAWTHS
jgi:chitinase